MSEASPRGGPIIPMTRPVPTSRKRERQCRCARMDLKHRRIAFIVRPGERRRPVHQSRKVLCRLRCLRRHFQLLIGLNALSAISARPRHLRLPRRSIRLSCSIPDWPLTCLPWSVRFGSTDLAKNGAARLAGVEPPRYEDKETTIAELKARLAKTVAFVKSLDPKRVTRRPIVRSRFRLARPTRGSARRRLLNHFVCRTYISTSPPPTRSCAIAVWGSESRISSVDFHAGGVRPARRSGSGARTGQIAAMPAQSVPSRWLDRRR